MRHFRFRWTGASLLVLVPLTVGCDGGEVTDDQVVPVAEQPVETAALAAQLPTELESRVDDYVAAWNGDDPAAVAAFFTEDATAVVGDSTYNGRDEIAQRWTADGVPVVSDLNVTTETVEQRGEDYLVTGTHSYMVTMPDQPGEEVSGRNITVWTRAADGSWHIRSSTIEGETSASVAERQL